MQVKAIFPMAVILIIALMLGACGQASDPPETEEPDPTPDPWLDEIITVVDPSGAIHDFTIADLRELEPVTEEITRERDEGTEQYEVTGVLLETLALGLGINRESIQAMTLTAGDGYAVNVPPEVLGAHRVIFAYEIEGEPLFEGTAPLRAFIPDSEAMYWVKNLTEIALQVAPEADIQASEAIFFLETIFAHAEPKPYGDDDEAIPTTNLLEYAGDGDPILMFAADGFEKIEQRDVFADAFIVVSGDTAPAFRGPDLPPGMHVRDLVWIQVGDTSFYSAKRGPAVWDTTTSGDQTGVSLSLLAEALQLAPAEAYALKAADGYSVEVAAEDLDRGVVYIRESGEVAVAFDDLPRRADIKDLLSMKVGTGGEIITSEKDEEAPPSEGEDEEDEPADATEPAAEEPAEIDDPWLDENITVVSLDGETHEFTLAAIRQMKATSEEITRETDSGVEEFTVTGVLLETLCQHLGVDPARIKGMTFEAGDGYRVDVPDHIIADHAVIFAYEIDGESLVERSAPLRAYLRGSESMYWVRNLVRIELSEGG